MSKQASFTPNDGDWPTFRAWCEMRGLSVREGFSFLIENFVKPDAERIIKDFAGTMIFEFTAGEPPKVRFVPLESPQK